MLETIKNAWKVKEIRIKIFITLGLILLFRMGSFIPVAGIKVQAFADLVTGDGSLSFLNIMDSVVGGALSQGTIFALGISPYINASIIMQLLTVGIPRLERLQKEGEEGRKKIAQYTRYFTVVLAIVQAVGILLAYSGSGLIDNTALDLIGSPEWLMYVVIVAQFTAGTMLAVWIGERITDHGVGNGISMLIFTGILATAGNQIRDTFGNAFGGDTGAVWELIGFALIVVVLFALIVWVDLAERKIPVQYAKQVKGRKMYGGQSTHIPIKVNASGVMPLIFAFAIISFPTLIISMFNITGSFATWLNVNLMVGSWLYTVLVSLFILFFAFFYAQIQFNPEDVSKNIQSYGGFIPGYRPGNPTTTYLRKISNRITLFGAIFLALMALVPSLALSVTLGNQSGLVNAVSTTGLLIIVSVALELDKQLESQIMMRHYKGFLD